MTMNNRSEALFSELVEDYGNYGYSVAMRILDNWEDANDAVQNALIKAWRGFCGLIDISKFNSWLSRIVRNCSYDIIKYKMSRKTVSLNEMEESDKDEYIEKYTKLIEEFDVDKILEDRYRIETIINLAKQLPRKQGSIVINRYIMGLSIKETSEILGIREGTVKSEAHRGITLLRKWVGSHV